MSIHLRGQWSHGIIFFLTYQDSTLHFTSQGLLDVSMTIVVDLVNCLDAKRLNYYID